MNENDSVEWLSDRFEQHRPHLRSVAVRMLGTPAEADDAVQEAWLRLSRSDRTAIDNLGGWLTTVVSRISLDMLRSRGSRREDPDDAELLAGAARTGGDGDPEHEAMLSDALGPALLVVLDTLTPAERLAFVLHDLFSVPFEEIGIILGRSTGATKQLAMRARQRMRASGPTDVPDVERQRRVVDAFLAASRSGNFEALLAVLDPTIVLDADQAAVTMGAAGGVRGAADVAAVFCGRAMGAEPAVIDGRVGMLWAVGERVRVVWMFTIDGDIVTGIEMIADTKRIEALALERDPA